MGNDHESDFYTPSKSYYKQVLKNRYNKRLASLKKVNPNIKLTKEVVSRLKSKRRFNARSFVKHCK